MHRPSLALAILALVAVGPVLGAEERSKHPAKATKPPAQGQAKSTPAATPTKPPAPTFDFATVVKKAEKLAARDYKEPPTVPDWLVNITYDQWRDIRFKPDAALWKDKKLPFQVQFFHPGLFYKHPIKVSVVRDDGQTTAVPFSPNDFDYGRNDFASKVPQDLGFAGFRVHAPIKTAEYYDEVIVFLGASYFRSLGRDEVFGLSARALSIDTAESWGEEFPAFREFWLVEPKPEDKSLTIYALLDSPRVAGAYKFVVTPGEQTTTGVDSHLFVRKEITKLGIAPLTSMFYHGENTARGFNDFRPEVHDSDGLLLAFKGGEWLWRPLDNKKTLSVSSLGAEDPVGWGLVQRDRDFASYQDLETTAERRPSAWVEPKTGWGKGRVELVEIPTNNELNDNIVTYWVPDRKIQPNEPLAFAYTLSWYGDDPARPPAARVLATRRDGGTGEGLQRFVIDFVGKDLAAIPADQVVRGVVTVAGGEAAADVLDQHVVKNPHTNGWRLTFQVRPKQREPIELRAYLDQGNTVLSETWSYALHP